MKKLLCERERRGSRNRGEKTGFRIHRYDDAHDYDHPYRAASSRTRNYDGKDLSDFLSPLIGYLRSRLGQNWDKIWSEICSGLDRRSVSGLHVFQHLKMEVETNCTLGPDGKIHGAEWKWRYRAGEKVSGFYVHPRTNLLCWAPRPRWRSYKRPEDQEFLWAEVGTLAYVKVKDNWFLVHYEKRERAPIEAYRPESHGPSFWRGPNTPDESCRLYWPSRWLDRTWYEAVGKKSLNKKEIKILRGKLLT